MTIGVRRDAMDKHESLHYDEDDRHYPGYSLAIPYQHLR
jgi:hypothetical protein